MIDIRIGLEEFNITLDVTIEITNPTNVEILSTSGLTFSIPLRFEG